jgi:site-specific recombinase XerD
MLEKGVDLRSLQVLLGHEEITTVEVYTHVETSQLRKIYDKKHPRS